MCIIYCLKLEKAAVFLGMDNISMDFICLLVLMYIMYCLELEEAIVVVLGTDSIIAIRMEALVLFDNGRG